VVKFEMYRKYLALITLVGKSLRLGRVVGRFPVAYFVVVLAVCICFIAGLEEAVCSPVVVSRNVLVGNHSIDVVRVTGRRSMLFYGIVEVSENMESPWGDCAKRHRIPREQEFRFFIVRKRKPVELNDYFACRSSSCVPNWHVYFERYGILRAIGGNINRKPRPLV